VCAEKGGRGRDAPAQNQKRGRGPEKDKRGRGPARDKGDGC